MIPLESAPQRIQLPERRLLVPEPTVKFDKLTPAQMGEVHGRIAEMPPIAVLQRLIAHDTWDNPKLDFLGFKHGMEPNPDSNFSSMGTDRSQEGKDYAVGYTTGIREYMEKHGVIAGDLDELNLNLLEKADQMDAFIDGFERVPYIGKEIIQEGLRDFTRTTPNPEGYRLGFAVGITRDFGLPISFTGVPGNDVEYNAFLGGLSGDKIPAWYGSNMGSGELLQSFWLGNRIHEIVEAEPLPQVA